MRREVQWRRGAWALVSLLLAVSVASRGFAAKDTLSNVFSGVFILADAPYKVVDCIVMDNGSRIGTNGRYLKKRNYSSLFRRKYDKIKDDRNYSWVCVSYP